MGGAYPRRAKMARLHFLWNCVSGPLRNASEVLMQSSRQVELPSLSVPPAGKELRSDHKLYNDLLSESLSMPQCEVAFYTTCTHHFSTCIHLKS